MEALTTKKSKVDFIRTATQAIAWKDRGAYSIKLVIAIQRYFKDQDITGVKALPKLINTAVGKTALTLQDFEIIGDLPWTPVTASNDYHAFMYSPGIPAHLKVLVLKAQL